MQYVLLVYAAPAQYQKALAANVVLVQHHQFTLCPTKGLHETAKLYDNDKEA